MTPLITIITPTVQRLSLAVCCESVNQQTFKEWEHIVMVDKLTIDEHIFGAIDHPQRFVYACDREYRNGGNTPRHLGWQHATGDWVYYLDDDNFLATPDALKRIANALEGVEEKWAIFPIHRHGSRFYFDPPQSCYFDTGNAIARREVAQWPDIDGYASDAVWLEGLKAQGPYHPLPDLFPVMVMEGTSFGAGGGINGQ